MKTLLVFASLLFSAAASAQYYYKDIVGTKESTELLAGYRQASVRGVALKSYTVNNTPLDNLSIRQVYDPAQRSLRTTTQSEYTDASFLSTYTDEAGRIVKTIDSSAGVVNTTLYTYNAAGKLTGLLFASGDTLTATKTDDHLWQYDGQGRISRMLRIKNKRDTAIVSFKLDDAGNVTEEQEKRGFLSEEPYYYYYDNSGRLTDVVRYNKKARRLLPETMLEYTEKGQVAQRISVPQNSDDYLIWRFAYDARGLKTKEAVFNKQKEQTGKVEYTYTYDK